MTKIALVLGLLEDLRLFVIISKREESGGKLRRMVLIGMKIKISTNYIK